MKKFGSILAFLAVFVTVVSGRALPVDNSVEARAPYPIGKALYPSYGALLTVYQMSRRYTLVNQRKARLRVSVTRDDEKCRGLHHTANGTASAAAAVTSATGKKTKGGKGAAAVRLILSR
jgi:hypothetical protein